METRTLLLNADYTPIRVLPWERALIMQMEGTGFVVETYDEQIRSQRLSFHKPAVLALRKYKVPKGRIKFSSRNVLARDGHICCYCGTRPRKENGVPDKEGLTMDHVIPRAKAQDNRVWLPWAKKWVNVTCWENAVCACKTCNSTKADRTPQEAGYSLSWLPRLPTPGDAVRISLAKMN